MKRNALAYPAVMCLAFTTLFANSNIALGAPKPKPSPSASLNKSSTPSPSPSPRKSGGVNTAPKPSASASKLATPKPSRSSQPKVTPSPSASRSTSPKPLQSKSPTPKASPTKTKTASPTASPSANSSSNPTPSPSPSKTIKPIVLPSTVSNPPAQLAVVEQVLKYAMMQTGKKYVLGGVGPNSFDCSGLVQTAWKKSGVMIPRTSGDQFKATIHISLDDALPGDLIFYGQDGKQHVAIYIGFGLIVEAANARKGVIISAIDEPWHHKNFGGVGRVVKSK